MFDFLRLAFFAILAESLSDISLERKPTLCIGIEMMTRQDRLDQDVFVVIQIVAICILCFYRPTKRRHVGHVRPGYMRWSLETI